jgi:hypothetical protein
VENFSALKELKARDILQLAGRNGYINHLLHSRVFSAANNLRILRWAGNITHNYTFV